MAVAVCAVAIAFWGSLRVVHSGADLWCAYGLRVVSRRASELRVLGPGVTGAFRRWNFTVLHVSVLG